MVTLRACLACLIALSPLRADDWQRAIDDPAAARLARPDPRQYAWQEQELAIFIQLDPATIQGREYDDGSTPMDQIRFERLDTDEWCRVAKALGARQIIFMLAHSGGFCMWPTSTTSYHIGNTAYRGGKGDVVAEFGASVRRHGLNAGIYLWLPRPTAEAPDPTSVSFRNLERIRDWKHANEVLETRIREVAERIGPDLIREIWVDQPTRLDLGGRLRQILPHAVLQAVGSTSPLPDIRWPGNEKGVVGYPCWSTLDRSRIAMPIDGQLAADERQKQGVENPDGDLWAPQEADTPLHDHFWHMRPGALERRLSVDQLVGRYVRSVGRNSFLIVNCAPQADGSVHPDDLRRYQEVGDEIRRRFGNPLAALERIPGATATLSLGRKAAVGYVDLWEDHRYGHRIRKFVIEGRGDGEWVKLAEGTAVGRRFLWPVTTTEVREVRVRVLESVGTPLIRKLQVHAPGR